MMKYKIKYLLSVLALIAASFSSAMDHQNDPGIADIEHKVLVNTIWIYLDVSVKVVDTANYSEAWLKIWQRYKGTQDLGKPFYITGIPTASRDAFYMKISLSKNTEISCGAYVKTLVGETFSQKQGWIYVYVDEELKKLAQEKNQGVLVTKFNDLLNRDAWLHFFGHWEERASGTCEELDEVTFGSHGPADCVGAWKDVSLTGQNSPIMNNDELIAFSEALKNNRTLMGICFGYDSCQNISDIGKKAFVDALKINHTPKRVSMSYFHLSGELLDSLELSLIRNSNKMPLNAALMFFKGKFQSDCVIVFLPQEIVKIILNIFDLKTPKREDYYPGLRIN